MSNTLIKVQSGAFALAALLCSSASAWADASLECAVGAADQVEISSCVQAQMEVTQAALDQALEFARNHATELDQVTGRDVAMPALEASQTAWTRYRDRQCSYEEALFAGGSGAGIAYGSCMVRITRGRIAELMATMQ